MCIRSPFLHNFYFIFQTIWMHLRSDTLSIGQEKQPASRRHGYRWYIQTRKTKKGIIHSIHLIHTCIQWIGYRLMELYMMMHQQLHSSAVKILYHIGSKEALLGWVSFQTYKIANFFALVKLWNLWVYIIMYEVFVAILLPFIMYTEDGWIRPVHGTGPSH